MSEHPLAKMTRLDEELGLYDDAGFDAVPLSPNVKLEVRPCIGTDGNVRCYDLGPPTEPGATGGSVVASVYCGKATADELARLWNTQRLPEEAVERRLSDALIEELDRQHIALDDFSPAINTIELARAAINAFARGDDASA